MPAARQVPADGVTYDARALRYRARGRFVSANYVQEAVEAEIDARQVRMRADANALADRQITVAQFQARYEEHIRRLHLATGTIGRGGFAQLSKADREWIRRRVVKQLEYLEGFAVDLASGKYLRADGTMDGRVVARADLYAQAGRATEREMGRRVALLGGHDEERRKLGSNDSCQTVGPLKGCLELSRMGWQPAGKLPQIGQTPCKTNCRCSWETRRAEA